MKLKIFNSFEPFAKFGSKTDKQKNTSKEASNTKRLTVFSLEKFKTILQKFNAADKAKPIKLVADRQVEQVTPNPKLSVQPVSQPSDQESSVTSEKALQAVTAQNSLVEGISAFTQPIIPADDDSENANSPVKNVQLLQAEPQSEVVEAQFLLQKETLGQIPGHLKPPPPPPPPPIAQCINIMQQISNNINKLQQAKNTTNKDVKSSDKPDEFHPSQVIGRRAKLMPTNALIALLEKDAVRGDDVKIDSGDFENNPVEESQPVAPDKTTVVEDKTISVVPGTIPPPPPLPPFARRVKGKSADYLSPAALKHLKETRKNDMEKIFEAIRSRATPKESAQKDEEKGAEHPKETISISSPQNGLTNEKMLAAARTRENGHRQLDDNTDDSEWS